MSEHDTCYWFGDGAEVERRLRQQIEAQLARDNDAGWVETPPTDSVIKELARSLDALDESLRPTFLRWWRDGTIDEEFSVAGYTPKSVYSLLRTGVFAVVFVWLDALIKNPVPTQRLLAEAVVEPYFEIIEAEPLH